MSLNEENQNVDDPIASLFYIITSSSKLCNPCDLIKLQSEAYEIIQSEEGIFWAINNLSLYKSSSIFIPLLSIINFWLSHNFQELSSEQINSIKSNVLNTDLYNDCFNKMSLIHSAANFILNTEVDEFVDFFKVSFSEYSKSWANDFLEDFLEMIKNGQHQDKIIAIEDYEIDHIIVSHIAQSCGASSKGMKLLLSCIDIIQTELLTCDDVLELVYNSMNLDETKASALEYLAKFFSSIMDDELKHSIIESIANPDIIEDILQDCEDEDVVYAAAELIAVIAPLNIEAFYELSMILYGESTLDSAEVLIDVINQIATEEQENTLLYTFNNIVELLESDECFIAIILDFLEIIDTCFSCDINSFYTFVSEYGSEIGDNVSNIITWILFFEIAANKGGRIDNIDQLTIFISIIDEKLIENEIFIFTISKLINLLSMTTIEELNYNEVSEKIVQLIIENPIFAKDYKRFVKAHGSDIQINEESIQLLLESPSYYVLPCLSIIFSAHTNEECGELPEMILENAILNIKENDESTILAPLKFISHLSTDKIELIRNCCIEFIYPFRSELLQSDKILNNLLKAAYALLQCDFVQILNDVITYEFHGKSLSTFISILRKLELSKVGFNDEILEQLFVLVQNTYDRDGSIICDIEEKRDSLLLVSDASNFAIETIQRINSENRMSLMQFFSDVFSSEYSELFLYEAILHFFNNVFDLVPTEVTLHVLENSWNHFLSNEYHIESELTSSVLKFHINCTRIEGFEESLLSGLLNVCDVDGTQYVELITSKNDDIEEISLQFYSQIISDRQLME